MLAAAALLLVPILLGTSSWRLPLLKDFEAQAYDWYSAMLAQRTGPRPDIVVLAFDEASAREAQRFSPIPKDLLARALRNLDRLGARAIGIDIVMTVRTTDAPELAQTLARMRTRTVMAYADPELDRATYWSEEADSEARGFQSEFWAAAQNSNLHQASPVVNLEADGVRRRWPRLPEASRRPIATELLGDAGRGSGYLGSIDFIIGAETGDAEAGVFDTLPLAAFADPDSALSLADLVRGRYVLIGADLENVDQATLPVSDTGDYTVSGVFVHAQMLAQELDGRLRPPVPTLAIVVLLVLAVAGGATTGTAVRRLWLQVLLAALQLAAVLSLPLAVQSAGYDRITLPLVGIALSWLVAFLSALTLGRRSADARTRFAQGALGRYLPKAVANEIIRDPEKLELTGQRRDLFIMFTDLEDFTSFSHELDPQVVAELLNDYLELVSGIILKHQGTIDKYIGDAVVAIWGAPLTTERDADNALACVLEIAAQSEVFRERWRRRGLSVGRTRIGLHFGEAVVGNFGGAERIQYTAIGDAMNTASRLEALNKHLCSSVVASGEAAGQIGLDRFVPLGRVRVAGRSTPIDLFQPSDLVEDSLAASVRLAYSRYQQGDAAAAQTIARLGEDHGNEVLVRFGQRLATHAPEEAFAFKEK